MALAGESASTVVVAVALPPSLLSAAQVGVQLPAGSLVPPHVPVDRLVADRNVRLDREATGDLFGAPALLEQRLHPREILRSELLISPRSGPTAIGPLLGLVCAITTVGDGAVAFELAADGAPMAAQHGGDLRAPQSLHSQGGEHIPLVRGDLAVRHGESPLLGGGETSSVSSDRLAFFGDRVALTL